MAGKLNTLPVLPPLYASHVGGAGAPFSLSITPDADPNLFAFLKRFTVTCPNVASVVSILITITGIATSLNYQFVETVSAGGWLDVIFDFPIPAGTVNGAITVNIPAVAGGGAIAVNMFGYQQEYR